MPVVPSPQDRSRCPICRADSVPGALGCAVCGARLDEAPAQELRAIIYLLAELKDWEAKGLMAEAEAEALRRRYELRRDELRSQIASNEGTTPAPLPFDKTASTPHAPAPETQAEGGSTARSERSFTVSQRVRDVRDALVRSRQSATGKAETALPFAATRAAERRPLFETLADPHTLRLLLYTGAAMLVVGIVIWLRDVLYLKLQEPLVQAVLLALGTVAVTIVGWLMTLRTRLRLTGRALTFIGSLLVPVNFWFLVRSGLISNNGRAWMVCAFCAALYAQTAALLRERLYVYLACAASVATLWTLVFRTTPEAYGLYALTLMMASLVFLHLSRLFAPGAQQQGTEAAQTMTGARAEIDEALTLSRWSYALWGPPLVRVALAGAGASALTYMLRRLGPTHSFSDGLFRWRAASFDSGIAMMLFAAASYVAWFAARYSYPKGRAALYTTSAVALFWTEFLLLDGLQLHGPAYLFAFSLTACGASLISAFIQDEVSARALRRVTDIVFTLLLLTASVAALLIYLAVDEAQSWRPSVLFVFVATILYGAARGWRERSAYGAGLSSLAVLVLVAALLDALAAAGLFPASWPISGGVVIAAFLLQRASARWLPSNDEEVNTNERGRWPSGGNAPLDMLIRLIADTAVIICALLWLAYTLSLMSEVGWSATCLFGLTLLYWVERTTGERRAPFVHLSSLHAGAFLLALLVVVGCEGRWMALVFTLLLFPLLFSVSRYARTHAIDWLARAARLDAEVLTALVSLAVLAAAGPRLETGNESLLAPALTAGAVCVVTLSASLFSTGQERVLYFRIGLCAAVAAFVLAVLRAGFDPLIDVEWYTSPVAVLLLIVSYLAVRREWDEYASDASLLLWTGAVLLCGPLLIRALQFRLLLDLPAPLRDLGVLCVSLLLILFGVLGRLRAPVITGATTLALELVALSLTSVEWLQVPLKIYLITAGALSIIVWGLFEYRREQLLSMRQRFQERSAMARERFGEWR